MQANKVIVFLVIFGIPLFSASVKEQGGVVEIDEHDYIKEIFDFTVKDQFVGKNELPIVLDFYATWCGPCKMLAPVLENLALKYKGKVQFLKVDAEQQLKLANFHGVKGYPTLFLIPKKARAEELGYLTGFMDEKELSAIIEKHFFNIKEKENE